MDRRGFLVTGAGAMAAVGLAGAQQGKDPSQQGTAANGTNPANDGSAVVNEAWNGQPFNGLLAGKVAVVTGAARGIGRCIAADFAANGADVVGIDIAGPVAGNVQYVAATPAELEETGRLVKARGRRWLGITADIREFTAMKAAADQVQSTMGHVDIVVANAAIQAFKPLLEMEESDWHSVVHNNLDGTWNTVRNFAPLLVARGKGRMILISSMQGRYGTKNGSAYSASKWGIIGLMKSAALELGKYKITVNTIEPGLIDTAMTHNDKRWSEAVGETMTAPPPEHPSEQQVIQARLPKTPLGVPWLKPEHVAPVAVFLASDAAEMVTGACYDVNGGDSAHDLG